MAAHIPRVSQLSPRVIRVLGCNPGPMTLQGTNTYLLGTGARRILVDTGDGAQAQYVDLMVRVLHESKAKLQQIILTHWHHDHVGGVGRLLSALGPPHPPVAKFPCTRRQEDPLPLGLQLELLQDGQQLQTEGATLKVLHTPGHTEDHIALFLQEEGAVLSGDCVLGEGTAVFQDLADYMESLQRLHALQPRCIYPGHGPKLDKDPAEHISFYLQHRLKRESQILATLKAHQEEALTAMQLVKELYVDTPEHLHLAAAGNVTHHLVKLLKEGRVCKLIEGHREVSQGEAPREEEMPGEAPEGVAPYEFAYLFDCKWQISKPFPPSKQ